MFNLCTASVIESTVFIFFTIIAQRVTLHTDRIKANFDGAFNFLNYVAMLPSSIDNDACTFKEATSI